MVARFCFPPLLAIALAAYTAVCEAKPPDLPADERIHCQTDGPGPVHFHINSTGIHAAVIPHGIILSDGDGEAETGRPRPSENRANTIQPGQAMPSFRLFLVDKSVAVIPGEEAVRSGDSSTVAACPYRKAHGILVPTAYESANLATSVLANLQKLETADELMRQARRFQEQGKWTDAAERYRLVLELCPGSRYQALAKPALAQAIHAIENANAALAEEEQEPAGPAPGHGKLILRPRMPGLILNATGLHDGLELEMEVRVHLNRVCPSIPPEESDDSSASLIGACREFLSWLGRGTCVEIDLDNKGAPRGWFQFYLLDDSYHIAIEGKPQR